MHVAPPIVVGANAYLLAECPQAIEVPPNHELLGCLRTVTFAGADQSYIAIHGVAPDVRRRERHAGRLARRRSHRPLAPRRRRRSRSI